MSLLLRYFQSTIHYYTWRNVLLKFQTHQMGSGSSIIWWYYLGYYLSLQSAAWFFDPRILSHVRVFAIANPSLSLSVVCNVRDPTQKVETFGNIFSPLCTLAILWPPCKILRGSFQGSPSVGSVKSKRGSKTESAVTVGISSPVEFLVSQSCSHGIMHGYDDKMFNHVINFIGISLHHCGRASDVSVRCHHPSSSSAVKRHVHVRVYRPTWRSVR